MYMCVCVCVVNVNDTTITVDSSGILQEALVVVSYPCNHVCHFLLICYLSFIVLLRMWILSVFGRLSSLNEVLCVSI